MWEVVRRGGLSTGGVRGLGRSLNLHLEVPGIVPLPPFGSKNIGGEFDAEKGGSHGRKGVKV